MLSLQRHNGSTQFDPCRPGSQQGDRDHRVEIARYLRDPRGVHAGAFGPLDIGQHPRRLTGGIAPLRPNHHSDAQDSSTVVPVSERTSRTRTSNGVPVGKTAAAPADSNFGTSVCGTVPPTTTAISPASAARSPSIVRVVKARCAPERMLKPTTTTSS